MCAMGFWEVMKSFHREFFVDVCNTQQMPMSLRIKMLHYEKKQLGMNFTLNVGNYY